MVDERGCLEDGRHVLGAAARCVRGQRSDRLGVAALVDVRDVDHGLARQQVEALGQVAGERRRELRRVEHQRQGDGGQRAGDFGGEQGADLGEADRVVASLLEISDADWESLLR